MQTLSRWIVILVGGLLILALPGKARCSTTITTELNAYTIKSYVDKGFHVRPDQAKAALFEAIHNKDAQLVNKVLAALKKMYGRIHVSKNLTQIVNSHDVRGLTPLSYGAIYGNRAIIEALINYGADPNASDNYGNTPLMQAAMNNHPDIVELLVDYGAKVNYRGSLRINNFKILGGSALMAAVAGGNLESVQQLVAMGADLEAPDDSGKTALCHAAIAGRLAIAHYLIAAGAHLDPRDEFGRTPLMFAVIHFHPQMVKLLIAAGANVHARDIQHQSPLEYASSLGDQKSLYFIQEALDRVP